MNSNYDFIKNYEIKLSAVKIIIIKKKRQFKNKKKRIKILIKTVRDLTLCSYSINNFHYKNFLNLSSDLIKTVRD